MKLTFAARLYLLVTIVLVSFISVGVIAYISSSRLIKMTERVLTNDVEQQNSSMDGKEYMGYAVHNYKNYLLRKDDKYVAGFKESVAKVDEAIKKYESLSDNAKEQAACVKARDSLNVYKTTIDRLVEAYKTTDDIRALDNMVKGADKPVLQALGEMDSLADEDLKAERKELGEQAKTVLALQITVAIIASLLALTVGVLTARRIISKLGDFSAVIDRVAANDLTVSYIVLSLSNSLTSLFSDTERHRRISVHSQVV